MKKHVHDCTGPDATCPCGYKFTVPRFSVSVDVYDGRHALVSDGFSSDSLDSAIHALRRAADRLEALTCVGDEGTR